MLKTLKILDELERQSFAEFLRQLEKDIAFAEKVYAVNKRLIKGQTIRVRLPKRFERDRD